MEDTNINNLSEEEIKKLIDKCSELDSLLYNAIDYMIIEGSMTEAEIADYLGTSVDRLKELDMLDM